MDVPKRTTLKNEFEQQQLGKKKNKNKKQVKSRDTQYLFNYYYFFKI